MEIHFLQQDYQLPLRLFRLADRLNVCSSLPAVTTKLHISLIILVSFYFLEKIKQY